MICIGNFTVGNWETVKLSGAVTESERRNLFDKVEKLLKAVKFAREQANLVDAPQQEVGEKIMSYLLG